MKKLFLLVVALFLLATPLHAQTEFGSISASSATCNFNPGIQSSACVQLNPSNSTNQITIAIDGTFSATTQFEFTTSDPSGTIVWRALQVTNLVSFATSTSTTTTGSFIATNANYTAVRTRTSTYASGIVNIRIRGTNEGGVTGLTFGGGSASIGTVTQGAASDASANWLVNCAVGCSGGTSDTDDGSIAGAQTTGLSLALNHVWDGSVWRRLTAGTAGTPAAQTLTVQGITGMTPFLTTSSSKDEDAFAQGTSPISQIGCLFNNSYTPLTTAHIGIVACTSGGSLHTTVDNASLTVIQGTGTNLHAVIDSGSTTAVTQSTLSALKGTFTAVDSGGTDATDTTNHAIKINCVTGCSGGAGGTSATDNATVTESTSTFTPVGGEFLTTPGTVTTGHQAMAAITAHRALQVSLFDTSGNAITLSPIATTNTTAQTTGVPTFGIGSTGAPTAVTTGNNVGNWLDLNGRIHVTGDASMSKILVTPDANSAINVAQVGGASYALGQATAAASQPILATYNTLKQGTTAAMTATTSTSVIAGTASNNLYITSCAFSNSHASVSTMMSLQDGSGGSTLWTGLVPFGGGSNITFPTPLKVPTQGNGLFVVNVTTGSNTFASCSGFISTVSY